MPHSSTITHRRPRGDFSSFHALVVGISSYQRVTPLAKARDDAIDLAELLIRIGYPPEQVLLLLDEGATKVAIDNALNALAEKTRARDTVLIFYSGHGVQRRGGLKQGEFLCPVGADLNDLHSTCISSEELETAVSALKTSQVVILLDACHAGGVGKAEGIEIAAGLSDQMYQKLAGQRGRIVIASCARDEVSWETQQMRNSLFTHCLLEGLRGKASSHDGFVHITHLFDYIVDNINARQAEIQKQYPEFQPQHPMLKGAIEKNFFLAGGKQDNRRRWIKILGVDCADDLKMFAYWVAGEGAWERLRGKTSMEKAESLLLLAEAQGQMHKLYGYIKEFRKGIDTTGLIVDAPPWPRVEFVNRLEEITKITSRLSAPYQLVHAPRGYGKTWLLEQIAHHYQKQGWLPYFVNVIRSGCQSCQDLLAEIAATAGGELPPQPGAPEMMEDWCRKVGYEIATCALGTFQRWTCASSQQSKGVVLLIDDVQCIVDETTPLFLGRFIQGLRKGLETSGPGLSVRLIMAGTDQAVRWNDQTSLLVVPSSLSPFTYAVVREAVHQFASRNNLTWSAETVTDAASNLFDITGGHPSCIAKIMQDFRDRPGYPPGEYLQENASQILLETVLPIVAEIRSVPHAEELRILSVCRRYTANIMKKFMDAGLLKPMDDQQLGDDLLASYLVRRKDGFLEDDITRRLLAIELRHTDMSCFLQGCQVARDAYLVELHRNRSRPERMAIELLFQELQLAHYTRRQAVEPGSINGCLDALIEGRDGVEALDDLLENMESDWEFQFCWNFLQRDSVYNGGPYHSLVAQVKDRRQAIPARTMSAPAAP